ncbi:flagellar basal body-associated FliL family protein [Cellulomonas sp. zg-ZUI222]|uniref:Flagellar protein FliL n=1 Tax=Cellulomonas wangleii TaxID=2816956 RepID=A0ABX8D6H8_9CELL|nr:MULTISPECIES: flagellar basal body-associated FliL family protein [Cellulomonas]MBO0901264.1 flagellar basal body-associated FliL family protein [Cellulomonas sp. zg-ZUI22]MBO0922427.1 flagellar basal body-associated FliL family protein [Cellulomonas wangleii]MBO0924868.1 flagellar basal body-associated FliL family protein [Cellulomonas wangleii]QVI63034.1 flagellar basal body-associated FliL family protein [Cellulomonas wangleii]
MPIEQRVVSRQKIGARGSAAPEAVPTAPPAPAGRPRRRLLLVVVLVLVLAVAGAAAWFLLGRDAEVPEAPVAEPAPVAGEVVQVDPISINLADGRYLRLGLGLQLTADAHGAPDPSRALDLAISLYSGRTVGEVSDPTTRDALKTQLAEQLAHAYEGEVMDVYLTNYVTQ